MNGPDLSGDNGPVASLRAVNLSYARLELERPDDDCVLSTCLGRKPTRAIKGQKGACVEITRIDSLARWRLLTAPFTD